MADLRVLSTGREFRRIDEGTAKLLEELFPGNLERINPAPQRASLTSVLANAESANIPNHSAPRWGIFHAPRTGKPSIQCEYLRGVTYYDGPPERADKFRVGTHTPPPEIIAAYIRALAGEDLPRASNNETESAKLAEKLQANADAAQAYLSPLLPWKTDSEIEAEQNREGI